MQKSQIFKFLTFFISSTFLSSPSFGDPALSKKTCKPCTPCEKKVQTSKTPISLQETLEHAYMQNTDLDAARAGLRAEDEDVSQAIADWRPSLSVQGTQRHTQNYSVGGGRAAHETLTGYTAQIQQNVFKGGLTAATIERAESNAAAGRAGLFKQEQDSLLAAIQAHTGIVANEAIVRYQQDKLSFTEKFLARAKAGEEVGEKGPTDVEIARAEYEEALAELSAAIAQLETSKATYLAQVGSPPGKLAPAKVVLEIPKTYEEALEVAKKRNPLIDQAKYALEAAEHFVNMRIAGLLPTVDVNGSVGTNNRRGRVTDAEISRKETDLSFSAIVNVPLYSQGIPNSQVRQAYQRVAQQKVALVGARRSVEEALRTAWVNLSAARDRVKSLLAEVKARTLAVEGAAEEYNVGAKSTIDVLLEQQKLTDSQIRLTNAQTTLLVSSYQVFAAMGRLTARDLKLNVRYYDPEAYYNEYKDAWIQFWQGEDLRYVKDEDLT